MGYNYANLNLRNAPPIPAYVLGAGSILLGLNCLLRPTQETVRFGLPLDPAPRSKRDKRERRDRGESGSERRSGGSSSYSSSSSSSSSSRAASYLVSDEGKASPLIQVKGVREITYGLGLGVLKWLRHEDAVTALTAVLALTGLGDGVVVWLHGGEKNRKKAWGHWAACVVVGGWAAWRAVTTANPRSALSAGGFQVFRK